MSEHEINPERITFPITWREEVAKGDRFTADAFDKVLGQVTDIKLHGKVIGRGRLTRADVIDGGAAVMLTLDAP